MLPLAIATSIDALAMGAGFAFLNLRILPTVSLIGAITFALSALGVRLGSLFGSRFRAPAQLTGGLILLLMGAKILIDHLSIP
jgi:putative Mn2+ efflux pump MntP